MKKSPFPLSFPWPDVKVRRLDKSMQSQLEAFPKISDRCVWGAWLEYLLFDG